MTANDKTILRRLAAHQLEVANSRKNRERVALWMSHNDIKGVTRPIVHIEIETFMHELIAPLLECEAEDARRLESLIYRQFYNLDVLDDDWVTPDYFPVEWDVFFHPFGFAVQKEYAGGDLSVGHRFVHPITSLEDDYEKLAASSFGVNKEKTKAVIRLAEDAFGDILEVRPAMQCLYAVPTQHVVHLMGMEQMMFALYDCPELFCKMMDRLSDDLISWFRQFETEGYLVPTTGFEWLGQGSLCFTRTLKEQRPLTTRDVWGFMDSQETVGVSPDMFSEFIFPYYRRIAECFGLLSYGCCEPVHPVWDKIKTLPNLRKVSVSPWCDESAMGEALRGGRIIYHRKPSPNYLSIKGPLDEDIVRRHLADTMRAASGCRLEITQRDVYTVGGDASKVRRYVELVRESIEMHWQP